MLLNTLLIVTLSSQCVWARKSEPSLSEGDTVGLFRGSDKYDFAIEIPAAGMECFWHFAHQSGSFYLTYMVQWVTGMANNHQLFVTVNSPDGVLVASDNKVVGQMNFQTEMTGFYRMCLGNHNNQFGGIRVFLSFGVIYKGLEESEREMEEGEKVLNSTLTDIEVFLSIQISGEHTEAPESDLSHLASLQLCPHEERKGSLPPPVQPQLRQLVVGYPKSRHPPVWIPAAPRP
ncbi:transmembrane emp24 domain-containing protein 6 isoform X2 [Scophthalmus maximus]|uniref:transmembrane emp24 domain-containing protein 6 isoform X2 n=1 Tax=Scophthalmus maximus TaxID=52904 RepID=UPI0015E15529|nr:transmembrane emp24 domain-containing protein 6 isoform X2 [Scophthalmus maximus]